MTWDYAGVYSLSVYHNNKKSIDNEGYIIRRIMLTNVTTNTRYRVVFLGKQVYLGMAVYIKITKYFCKKLSVLGVFKEKLDFS